MNKLLVLALLFGAAFSAKIPLHKKPLTMQGLLNQKERLLNFGSKKFLNAGLGEEVPISDYENT